MSQTLSRITIIFYLVVVERLRNRVQFPDEVKLRKLRDKFIAQLMDLRSPPGSKTTRDIVAMIANFLSPKVFAKISVSDQIARQFHHTPRVHDMSYSSSPFSVDDNGNSVNQSIQLATEWHLALGEPIHDSDDVQRAENGYREPTASDLDSVAAMAYSNPAASVTGVQNRSVRHVLSQDRHLIVKAGCGTGKSGIYILPLLYARCFRVTPKRILVISPYNALLSQHVQQARHYFRTTNLTVEGILSADVESLDRARFDSNLTFVSIQAFKLLRDNHEDVLRNSSFDVCVIDEIHNIFCEVFRISTWASLRLLGAFGWKLVAMSATVNSFLSEKIAEYLGVSGHVDKVGCQEYRIPKVAIRHVPVPPDGLLERVAEFVRQTSFYDPTSNTASKCHIVTATRDDAVAIQLLLSRDGVQTAVLTSDTSKEDREAIMERWDEDPTMTALASTIIDGIDSRYTQTVVIMKNAGCVVKTIQAIGRIRPPRQLGKAALACYFDTNFDPGRQQDIDRNQMLRQSMFSTLHDSEEDKEQSRMKFASLFESSGLDHVFNDGEGCLRQGLLRMIDVESRRCGMCSKCDRHNHVAIAAAGAEDQLQKESELRESVISSLADMAAACPGCLSPDCNGFKCIDLGTGNSDVCIKCHGVHAPGVSCAAKFIEVRANACPYCFLPFHKDIDGTNIEVHSPGKCVHRDRIRHILLLDLRACDDNGRRAHDRLVACSANHDEWFAVMERNLRTMKDAEISEAAISTVDDEELLMMSY